MAKRKLPLLVERSLAEMKAARIGIANSLDTKLANALAALNAANAGNRANVCNVLGAFINETQAQAGKKLTQAQAADLIADANRIRAVLGCQ